MPPGYQARHVQGPSQILVASATDEGATFDGAAREPLPWRQANEGRQRLGIAEATYITGISQDRIPNNLNHISRL